VRTPKAGYVGAHRLPGKRVAIVGGSLAGCAAAIAMRRAACEVTILERTRGELPDRGAGLVIPAAIHEELVAAGYLGTDVRAIDVAERLWFVDTGHQRQLMWRQPFPGLSVNWALLWRALRARLPDEIYREGTPVARVEPAECGGPTVVLGDGAQQRYDLVIGADGYRSAVRQRLHRDGSPTYVGYVMWRGSCPVEEVPAYRDLLLSGNALTVCFDQGHLIMYPIASDDGPLANWGIYTAMPDWAAAGEAGWIPPGQVPEDPLAELLRRLPGWGELVQRTGPARLAVQPIYETTAPRYIGPRTLLIGDAATVARPHTGTGALKAMQDALALERIAAAGGSWEQILAAYDAERRPVGNRTVELGQRLGEAQVLRTPDWSRMTRDLSRRWIADTLESRSSWVYSD
jgi:2-polyprenyl-6-methoxyphenol hydroxylase-like FAD-dependent oxidoreductase